MAECIHVVARFRPTNQREKAETAAKAGSYGPVFLDDRSVELVHEQGKNKFAFDRVYKMDTTQQDFYAGVALPTVQDILAGFNGTILGKSFSMMGQEGSLLGDSRGVIPRVAQDLFSGMRALKAQEGTTLMEFNVCCSYMDIYLERVTDLFQPESKNLEVHDAPEVGVWVEGLSERAVSSEQAVLDAIEMGSKNRVVAFTQMNAVSSRSHAIFVIRVEQKHSDGSIKQGRLFLVDLAGSEKVGKTGAAGQRLEEAKVINKSLSALGNCINALSKGAGHVPYRDSRLTHILKESLGGNTKTTLILACSPSSFNITETLSTLRAKLVKNKPTVNKVLSAEQLQREVDRLLRELADLREYTRKLEGQHPGTIEVGIQAPQTNAPAQSEVQPTAATSRQVSRISIESEMQPASERDKTSRFSNEAKALLAGALCPFTLGISLLVYWRLVHKKNTVTKF
eukprot:m51a1_g3577 putative kinesin heavy chain, C-tail anchored protein (454) ;mRNA; f:1115004-1116568